MSNLYAAPRSGHAALVQPYGRNRWIAVVLGLLAPPIAMLYVARPRRAAAYPADHYFVMGDNRDNSNDSRYWGFVPEDHFLGRVSLVWYSARDAARAGTAVE